MSEAALAGFTRLLSDDRLTRRAVGGDERAFATIFSRYHQSLYRFCLAIVGNPDDAQDALQNTMIKVLRALPGEERRIELKPWLYRIAHNESIDLLRRRRETRQLDVEQIAPGYGLAEDAEARERLRRLVADMRELPERQRGVLVMRELGGLGFAEIGAALGTSDAVARQTLYEARQSLRQMEQGREMSCADVTRAISDGDGRVTRRRDVRAHLRACADCRRFHEAIEGRRRDFAALSPLPAVASAGMLNGLLGGSHAAGASGGSLAATLGGGAAKGIGASAAAKGLATAAVVAAIGITAADRSGVVHLGLPGEQATTSTKAPAPPRASAGKHAAAAAGGVSAHKGAGAHSGAARASRSNRGTRADGQDRSSASAVAHGPAAHPHGRGHEHRRPQAAGRGQETAASHSPPQRESKGRSSEHAVTPAKPAKPPHPSTPSGPSGPPEKEQPEAPQAAPEPAPKAQPSLPVSPREGVEARGKNSL